MSRRIVLFFSLTVLVALSVSGYFLFRLPPADNEVIRIGVLKHESSLPIYLADELGLFDHYNVHVQLVEVPPGDHMPALLSGRVDILSPTSFTALFGVIQQHPDAVYAVFPGAEVLNGPTVYGFVIRNDFAGTGIDSLRKTVVMAINPYTQVNIRTILTSANIPQEEWPEIRVASREVALHAVSDGTAQAAIMDQPALAVALNSGSYRLLEANPRARHIGSPYWSGAGAVTKLGWERHKEKLTRLMAAIDDALDQIKADPNAAHLILSRRLGIDEKVASQMGGYYFPKSMETVPMDGIQATVGALVNSGLLSKAITLDQFFPPGLYGQK